MADIFNIHRQVHATLHHSKEMENKGEKERVCVTGAGGYVASWLVKFLLSKGYIVHGTVRDPCDEKNGHLKKLDNSLENLVLFKTDLFDYEGLCGAFAGCTGIFHVACPVPGWAEVSNPEVELIEPSVTGTRNVHACLKAKVKRLVLVSSIGAVMLNPNWPKDQPMNEECWSDEEFCKTSEEYYCLGKTVAEKEAFQFATRSGLDIIAVCPSIIIGPMLQSTLNASSKFILAILKDGSESLGYLNYTMVDVRDVAKALMLVYEKPEVKGRYICTSYSITMQELTDKLKIMYPNYNFPKSFTGENTILKLSSEKLQNIGWKFMPLEDSIVDSVNSYIEHGILHKI